MLERVVALVEIRILPLLRNRFLMLICRLLLLLLLLRELRAVLHHLRYLTAKRCILRHQCFDLRVLLFYDALICRYLFRRCSVEACQRLFWLNRWCRWLLHLIFIGRWLLHLIFIVLFRHILAPIETFSSVSDRMPLNYLLI